MASTFQPPRGHNGVVLTLDVFIQALNLAKDTCEIPPAQVAFGAASVLVTTIRDTMTNDQDYVELGRASAGVCQALYRRLKGRQLDELDQSVLDAIGVLTATVARIQKKAIKQGKRRVVSRLILAKSDKNKIAVWKRTLVRVLHVFNTELAIDTNAHTMVADIHGNVQTGQEGTSSQNQSARASLSPGEPTLPAPRVCFGRGELIEKVVGLAEDLKPIALIGAGGIGKTSVALAVLHHDRIKERFGENRRFIRCDQFLASRAHFLARLSEAIGAGVENAEDLTPLQPFLSSKKMLIVLDNAESILDPKGTDAEEICSVVDELCQFKTICLLITSRISTVPPHCERPEIPTLSMEAACDIFYGIYGDGGRSSIIDDLLRRLDFHALSITLLATAASHNAWDYDRLVMEWDAQRAQVLQAGYNKSLAATIELSLVSPTFLSLGPDARDLLAVVAFFPQGIDEKNLDWLFPTISDRKNIFDKFCVLSLTHRTDGFVTMLAPIRDHFVPKDPQSSALLCTTRDYYFSRLSVHVDPDEPGFGEAVWIVSEDVNVEHLFDTFTSIDPEADGIWDVCDHFMRHMYWYKPRQMVLGSKVEALPDEHECKPKCLLGLSQLFQKVGNGAERKRLLTRALELQRQREEDSLVVVILKHLSDANRLLDLYEEGIRQAKEALEISERIGDTMQQLNLLNVLSWLFLSDGQLDAAEDAASRAIDLVSEKGQEFLLSQLHRVLGKIHHQKGEKEKGVHHFEISLRIASPFNWDEALFWIHHDLAKLFRDEDRFEDANFHIEQAKPYIAGDAYKLGRATHIQANVWYLQDRTEDAKSEVLCAIEIFEKLGAVADVELCRELLQMVEDELETQSPVVS